VSMPPSEETVRLLDDMLDFIKNSQDEEIAEKYELRAVVGLAAPQLRVNQKLLAIHLPHNDEVYSYPLINPKVISHSVEKAYLPGGEGCLSVDENIDGYVIRNRRITVRAYNKAGEKIKFKLKGYPAIVMQHEIDHLNGIMFYDYIDKQNPYQLPDHAHAIEYNKAYFCKSKVCFILCFKNALLLLHPSFNISFPF